MLAMQPGLTAEPAHSSPDNPVAMRLDLNNLIPKTPTYEQVFEPQLARRDQQIAQAKVVAEAKVVADQKAADEEAQRATALQSQRVVTYIPQSPAPTSDVLTLAQSLAAQRGWTGQQWLDLVTLGNKESGWNPNALNPSSGACGIPQALPCSKLPDHSVTGQITWMLDYIQQRYSTPSNALAFHYAHNWY